MENNNINLLFSTKKFRQQKDFWLENIECKEGIKTILENCNKNYTYTNNYNQFKEINLEISKSISRRVIQIGKNLDMSIYIMLLSAVNIMIYRYTGESNINIMSPVYEKSKTDETFNEVVLISSDFDDALTYKQFLLKMREIALKVYQNQDYPIKDILEYLNLPYKELDYLSNIMCLLINIHNEKASLSHHGITFIFNKEDNDIVGKIRFNSHLFNENFIEKMGIHFVNVLTAVMNNIDINIVDIPMLSENELRKLLVEFNESQCDYPKDLTVIQLFEKQVEMTPNSIAARYGEEKITYDVLNRKSNQLARLLRKKGVRSGTIIGVIGNHSIEMLIMLLGILKSGGTYLPIDMEYPINRIQYMLKDSSTNILMGNCSLSKELKYSGEYIEICYETLNDESDLNLTNINSKQDIAYIIYTSGTTGRPKGALITHQGLVNYIWWAKKTYIKEEQVIFPLYSSISFDLTVTSIYTPLISGGQIVIYDKARDVLKRILDDKITDIIKLTPAHLKIMEQLNIKESSIKKIIVGGENLTCELAQKIYSMFDKNIEIYNEYGPTETVVGCMIYKFESENNVTGSVPIGIPADNVQIYLLDKHLNPVPQEMIGEIYISGDGVGKGYINNITLTEEKFIANPFIDGLKMYKTGDIARMLPDYNIEYIGRVDKQVKMRGYRIEVGEIEEQLKKHPSIQDAIVLTKEDNCKNKILCAYLVSDKELILSELNDYLNSILPDYMLPSFFYQVDYIPLNINGKVDERALSEFGKVIQPEQTYTPAQNIIQEKLVEIWQKVLNIERIGIEDSFFLLGGDSIKAIQVSAQMQKANFDVGIEDIFEYSTIKELSNHVRKRVQDINQDIVLGEIPLTPIQRWFFSNAGNHVNHYNQSVMLYRKEGFDEKVVERVLEKITVHHDALRMCYKQENGEIIQRCRGVTDNIFQVEVIDLKNEKYDLDNKIEEISSRIQGSLNIEEGPLIKLGIFKTGEGDHLLIAIHHLVIDGVSWRIFLEDFETLYVQIQNNEIIQLLDKTNSYKEWSNYIIQYSQSNELLSEESYWENCSESIGQTLFTNSSEENASGDIQIELDEYYTEQLIKKVNITFNTQINDILLTSLGSAITKVTGVDKFCIALEGHGREGGLSNLNIIRTIGWFTSIYPVLLDMTNKDDYRYLIKNTKESLRKIPNKGIGYSILKYITPSEKRTLNLSNKKIQVAFNYNGQVSDDVDRELFQQSHISVGKTRADKILGIYPVDINAAVINKKLLVKLTYNGTVCDRTRAELLLSTFIDEIKTVIDFCIQYKEIELTPSDVGDSTLEIEELDKILNVINHINE